MSEDISRSEQKRQFKQVEAVAKELAELGDATLRRFPGSDQLKQEIVAVRSVKAGARKRQIKFVAKLLHQEPLAEIFHFLQQEKGSKLEENRFQHQAEKLRDELINDALAACDSCRQFRQPWEPDWQSDVVDRLVALYPDVDEHEIRRCAHQYARNRNKSHYRELFRIIKAAAEKKRLTQR